MVDPRGGFEPPLTGSEPAVLPLDDRGIEVSITELSRNLKDAIERTADSSYCARLAEHFEGLEDPR